MSLPMSLTIKLFLMFLLIESSIAKQKPDLDHVNVDMSEIDYSSFFKQMIEGWEREANEKYPFRPDLNNDDSSYFLQSRDQVYVNRSFFVQGKAQAYIRQWNNWKPYRDLGNKIGVLWPTQDNDCPKIEAMNPLTYMIHGLSRRYNILPLLK
ncbi:putative protein [Arabidopsis thaliana]|uniref:At4g12940 n=1 Tax=Arabidopsis thaliana TaxID=3702 RepID=Q9SV75_ARATH|nr:uncharacterized protein AT4G12940 [Arabidopsis thaliana]ABK32138.1 At4g12940 [Arabidopsis thaliana]AEE83205.1 hypothetical protein AT4G12940 [Arabidopsis thaliana]CAB45493.1 putative protein [Arabidopsis thaliana]CAB78336.1 putative protein [Arabidopsis thaliana]|eukprot:NP_193030.1 hypothetical protein AT4G12940 [Arabidopsis thaliana]